MLFLAKRKPYYYIFYNNRELYPQKYKSEYQRISENNIKIWAASPEDLKNSWASSWLPSPIWEFMLLICQSILLGDNGPPFSLRIMICCSSSHMRHQSFEQPGNKIKGKNISQEMTIVLEIYIYIYIHEYWKEKDCTYMLLNVIHKENRRQEALCKLSIARQH